MLFLWLKVVCDPTAEPWEREKATFHLRPAKCNLHSGDFIWSDKTHIGSWAAVFWRGKVGVFFLLVGILLFGLGFFLGISYKALERTRTVLSLLCSFPSNLKMDSFKNQMNLRLFNFWSKTREGQMKSLKPVFWTGTTKEGVSSLETHVSLASSVGKRQGPFNRSSLCNVLIFPGKINPSKPCSLTSDYSQKFHLADSRSKERTVMNFVINSRCCLNVKFLSICSIWDVSVLPHYSYTYFQPICFPWT